MDSLALDNREGSALGPCGYCGARHLRVITRDGKATRPRLLREVAAALAFGLPVAGIFVGALWAIWRVLL